MNNKIECAWCTLVMLDETYAAGAVIVSQSLKAVESKYPIYCMVVRNPAKGRWMVDRTYGRCDKSDNKSGNKSGNKIHEKKTKDYDGISQECIDFMKPHFAGIIEVPFLTASTKNMRSVKQDAIYGDWINHCFTKGWILDPLIQPAKKMIFLDADMIFTKNCDELFELSAPAMTFSSPWAYPYHVAPKTNPLSKGHYNPYWNDTLKCGLKHGEPVPNSAIEFGLTESNVGFACMMLIEPNEKLISEFLRVIGCDGLTTKRPIIGYNKCISGFDEQVFAKVFLTTGTTCYNIHQQYNWIVGKDNWLMQEGDKTNGTCVPYTQQWYNGKPWNQKGWPDLAAWWKLADELLETHPEDKKWFCVTEPTPPVHNYRYANIR